MGKKKKGKAKEEPLVTEVDKTFYELQITDLNRKLARLKTFSQELETKNVELEENLVKLDEDRADVIAFLKRSLIEKTNDVLELQERVAALTTEMETLRTQYDDKVNEMTFEYDSMRETLTSEVKLITGKLNALEEFRMQRDDLMQKYLAQEKNFEDQEIRHKRVLYETEKKFILSKDAIKREMEQQLFQLASDFEKANELRIAATTQRIIRENITLGNEINKLISAANRLERDNDVLQSSNRNLRLSNELYQNERDKALSDSNVQAGVIDQLAKEHKKQQQTIIRNGITINEAHQLKRDLHESKIREDLLLNKINILEQNLHAIRCEQCAIHMRLKESEKSTTTLENTLYEAIFHIKSALLVHRDPNLDDATRVSKRENLLINLLNLLTESRKKLVHAPSVTTITSLDEAYRMGDLGFIPKLHLESKEPPLVFNADSQVGHSFEDFLKLQIHAETPSKMGSETMIEEDESYIFKEDEEKSLEEVESESSSIISIRDESSDESDKDKEAKKLKETPSQDQTTEISKITKTIETYGEGGEEAYGEGGIMYGEEYGEYGG